MFQHDGSLAYCDSQLSSRGPHASTGAASVAAAAAVQPPRPYSVRLPVPFGPAMPQAAPAPLPFAAGSEAEVWLSGWMRLAAEEEGLSPRRLSASPDASRLFAAASPSRGAPAHPGSCSAFPSNGSAGCGSGVHKRGAEVPACELHAASRAWPLAATVSRWARGWGGSAALDRSAPPQRCTAVLYRSSLQQFSSPKPSANSQLPCLLRPGIGTDMSRTLGA